MNKMISLEEVAELWFSGKLEARKYWTTVCPNGHESANSYRGDTTKKQAEYDLEHSPFCKQDGLKRELKESESEWWTPPQIDFEKEEAFLRKYFPDYFKDEPAWESENKT